jgi:hypothetical protein
VLTSRKPPKKIKLDPLKSNNAMANAMKGVTMR